MSTRSNKTSNSSSGKYGNRTTLKVEPSVIGQHPVELRIDYTSAMPETPALEELIRYNNETVELGIRFRGMRDWTHEDIERITWLRSRIADLWIQRRAELAELRKRRAEWIARSN